MGEADTKKSCSPVKVTSDSFFVFGFTTFNVCLNLGISSKNFLINANWSVFKLLKNCLSIFFLFLSIFAKIFNLLKIIFGYLSSKFVFLIGGNTFYESFKTDFKLIKNLKFKKVNIRVKINHFWDYWRVYNYESFPVDCVLNDIESYNKQSKKPDIVTT